MFAAGLGNGNPVAEHIWLPCCTPWGPPVFNHAGITFEKQNLIIGLVLAIVLHPDFSPGERRAGTGGEDEIKKKKKKKDLFSFAQSRLELCQQFLFVRFKGVPFDFFVSLHLIPA